MSIPPNSLGNMLISSDTDANGRGAGNISRINEPETLLSHQEEDELRAKIRAQMFGGQFKEKVIIKMAEARFGEMQAEEEPEFESEHEASGTGRMQENEQSSYLDKDGTEQCISPPERGESSSSLGRYSERDGSITDDGQDYAKPSMEYGMSMFRYRYLAGELMGHQGLANGLEHPQSRVSFGLGSYFPPFNASLDPFVERGNSSTPPQMHGYTHSDDQHTHSDDDYSTQADVLDEYTKEYPDLEYDGEYEDQELTPTRNLFCVSPPSNPSSRTYECGLSSSRFRRPTLEQHLSDCCPGFQSTRSVLQGQKKHRPQPLHNSLYSMRNVHIRNVDSLLSTNRASTASADSDETLQTLTPRASPEQKPSLVLPDHSPTVRFDKGKQPFPSFIVSEDNYEKSAAYGKVRTMLLGHWFEPSNSTLTLTPQSSDPSRLHGMQPQTPARNSVRSANHPTGRGGIGNWSGGTPRSPRPDGPISSSASLKGGLRSPSVRSAFSTLRSASGHPSRSPSVAAAGGARDKGRRVWAPPAREEPSVRALRIARGVLLEVNATFGSPAVGTFNAPDLVPDAVASFEKSLFDAREAEQRLEDYALAGKRGIVGIDGNVVDAAAYKRMMGRYEKDAREKIRRRRIEETRIPPYGYEAAWAVRFVEWAEQWEGESRKLREDGLREMLAARGPQAGELGWKTRQEDGLDDDDGNGEDEDEEAEAELAESESAEEDVRARMERWAAEVDAGLLREKERQARDALESKRREAGRKAEVAAQKEKMNEWNRQLKQMEVKEKQRQKRQADYDHEELEPKG